MENNSQHFIFTIVAKNYLAQSVVLAESLLENTNIPPANIYVFVAETTTNELDVLINKNTKLKQIDKSIKILSFEEVDYPHTAEMFSKYSPTEYCTAIKPTCFRYLIDSANAKYVHYIDPDIYVYNNLGELRECVENHSIVLTPHLESVYGDNFEPRIELIQQSGVYNFGYLGVNSTHEKTQTLLQTWEELLKDKCVSKIEEGIFVDQKWGNLFPCLIDNFHVFKHPGYNVAYWNLHERSLTNKGDKTYVNGEELAFFHFSGYNPLSKNEISKYTNRFKLEYLPTVKDLFYKYGETLLSKDYEFFSSLKYGPFLSPKNNLSNSTSQSLSLKKVLKLWIKGNLTRLKKAVRATIEIFTWNLSLIKRAIIK